MVQRFGGLDGKRIIVQDQFQSRDIPLQRWDIGQEERTAEAMFSEEQLTPPFLGNDREFLGSVAQGFGDAAHRLHSVHFVEPLGEVFDGGNSRVGIEACILLLGQNHQRPAFTDGEVTFEDLGAVFTGPFDLQVGEKIVSHAFAAGAHVVPALGRKMPTGLGIVGCQAHP